jgi:hypothetical protein
MNGAVAIDMFLSLRALVRYWVALIAANLINLFNFFRERVFQPAILFCYSNVHIL